MGSNRGVSKPTFSERNVHTIDRPPSGRLWCAPADPAAPTGFRLMVTATGYRAYYVIYRPRGTSQSRAHLIGPAEDLSYKEAKSKAETIRGLVAEGKDPVADEQAARKRKKSTRVVTLRDVADNRHYTGNFLNQVLKPFGIYVANKYFGAVGSEGPRNFPSDTGRACRD